MADSASHLVAPGLDGPELLERLLCQVDSDSGALEQQTREHDQDVEQEILDEVVHLVFGPTHLLEKNHQEGWHEYQRNLAQGCRC